MSTLLRSAATAARSTFIVAATAFAATLVRVLMNAAFDKHRQLGWQSAIKVLAIFATVWFLVVFLYTYFKLRSYSPVEEILAQSPSQQSEEVKPSLSGFVAMEYYALILNRTFVIFIAPEGLYGWKAEGPVTASQPSYFEPYAEMLKDPALMGNAGAVRELSAFKRRVLCPAFGYCFCGGCLQTEMGDGWHPALWSNQTESVVR